MRRNNLPAAMVATCWVCSPVIAQRADVEIGVLTCSLAEPREAQAGSVSAVGGRVRDILCSFRARDGAEETYVGRVQGISLSADEKGTLLWLVKGALGKPLRPGLLQQSYAADPARPADQLPPMIGEVKSDIVLHSMSDKKEGSASAAEKSPAAGFIVIGVELELKSTWG